MRRWLLLILTALLFACPSEPPSSQQQQSEDESKPQDGGTLVRRLRNDVATLNPILADSLEDRYVTAYLFTPLLNFDVNLQCVPGLAEKWEVSPDGKVYTFHLFKNATFSDGSPVLPSDVIWSLKKIIDPTVEAAQLAAHFDKVDFAKTQAVDAHTVTIAFKEAFAPQLSFFNDLLVVPEHVYGKGDFKTDYALTAVSSGPYRLVRREAGKEVLIERRPDFWGVKPHLERVLFKVINDDATAWNAMKHGDVDETMISSDTWLNERNNPQLQKAIDFRRFYTLNYNYIPWNLRNPILAEKRVRRALAMCVDLRAVIDNLYHGTARAVIGHFTPDRWAYNPEVQPIDYNPTEAKRILNSLGWLDTDGDGILDKDHKPFKLDMLITAGSAIGSPFSQMYQAELKKIGVQLNVIPLDGTTMIQRVLAGNYECGFLSWELDPDPDPYQLFHSSQFPPHGQNVVFYSSPVADKLIEQGRATFDQKKRIEIYRQLQQVFADDQPYAWTVQVSTKWAINKRVRGVRESNGWGLFKWVPGELDWWIPARLRTHDVNPPASGKQPAASRRSG